MTRDYYVMYNPPIYNIMDLWDYDDVNPFDVINYLTAKNAYNINESNFLEYLEFNSKMKRESMVESFAVESYAMHYIGAQIAKIDPEGDVVLVDGKRRTIKEVIKNRDKLPLAVFITCMSTNFPAAAASAIILNYAEIPVIIGGIHVSTSQNDVDLFIRKYVSHPEIVTYVIGPGDTSILVSVINDLKNSSLKKKYRGSVMIENGMWKMRDNIFYLPPIKMKYLPKIPLLGKWVGKVMRIIPVAPYLGCPYSCNFCSISTLPLKDRKFTARDVDDFLDELEYHQCSGKLHSRYFFFLPDNLVVGKKVLNDILNGIIKRKLRVNFATQISIDIASDETLLRKLRDAGATHFFIGLESLDNWNISFTEKHISSDIQKSGLSVKQYYARQIRKIQNYGISIHGSFIFGLPYDYFHSIRDNTGSEIAEFCISNHIGLQPCSLTALPGSKLFKKSQDEKSLLYGPPGSMKYLLSLCLTDLAEINRIPPASLSCSPLLVAIMSFEAVNAAASTKTALANSLYIAWKAFKFPTKRGRSSFRERMIDVFFAFASQLIVSLYKEQGLQVVQSNGARGIFERLHYYEKDPHIRSDYLNYIKTFCVKSDC